MKTTVVMHWPKYALPLLATAVLLLFGCVWYFTDSLACGTVAAGLASFTIAVSFFVLHRQYANKTYEIDDNGITISKGGRGFRIPFEDIKRIDRHVTGITLYCKIGQAELRLIEERDTFYREIVKRTEGRTRQMHGTA